MKSTCFWAASVVGLFAVIGTATAGETQPNAEMTAVPSEQALLVSGRIGPDFEPRIRAWLSDYPRTKLVIMRSPGGLRRPALQVAELINERGMTVRISGSCASACALLWAAADSREMTSDSRLGLHRSHLPELPLALPAVIEKRIVARNDHETNRVLREAGFSPRLIAKHNWTPPTSMSWFDPADLKRDGVPFILRDSGQNGASPTASSNSSVTHAHDRAPDANRTPAGLVYSLPQAGLDGTLSR